MEQICLLKVIGTSVLCFFAFLERKCQLSSAIVVGQFPGFQVCFFIYEILDFSFFHITPFKAEIGLYISHISNK